MLQIVVPVDDPQCLPLCVAVFTSLSRTASGVVAMSTPGPEFLLRSCRSPSDGVDLGSLELSTAADESSYSLGCHGRLHLMCNWSPN